ncbi:MAG: hypothetical protein KIT84_33670 [Labilithrix sp.]|nr:hypothetical protein [Labilithrix sp.]MCW5815997.1 hypothetical protein [Labilithrix sp.]
MIRTHARSLALLFSAALTACTAADNGNGNDDTAATDPAPTAKNFGTFNFQTQRQGSDSAQVVAATFSNTSSDPSAGCSAPEISGSCAIRTCNVPSRSGGITFAPLPAGEVSASVGATDVALKETNGFWVAAQPVSWRPGDTLKGRASGAAGGAPAFDLEVKAPSIVAVSAPVFPGGIVPKPLAHAKSQDLKATWTDGTEGTVQLLLSTIGEDAALSIMCEAPATAGELVVPAAVLARIPTPRAFMTLEGRAASVETKGDWLVGVISVAPALDAQGREVKGFIELQ